MLQLKLETFCSDQLRNEESSEREGHHYRYTEKLYRLDCEYIQKQMLRTLKTSLLRPIK